MQNRYSGDIGDFGKLGLLRHLQEAGFSVGVNWYLTPDEAHNSDGRFTDYLNRPSCDEPLRLLLKQHVHLDNRLVSSLQHPDILQAKFFSDELNFADCTKAERQTKRQNWHQDALLALGGCQIIFADPDNGLMVPSAEGKKKSNKFVTVQELADHYQNDASVIYYQHKARRRDDFYRNQHQQLLESGAFPQAAGFGLKFQTTSQRYYFFLVHPEHAADISNCVENFLQAGWSAHFSLL